MPEVHVQPDAQQSAQAAASFIAARATSSIRKRERFTIALSGGSTPRCLYEELAMPLYASTLSWERWRVFWGDERCVPPDHEDSNYRMAKEALLDGVPIPPANVHRIRGEAEPGDAAREYEEHLRRLFQPERPMLDLVLLGIGEDGHTASLFPGSEALGERERLVVANWASHLRAYRITFTFPLINAAQTVVFLVEGLHKAEAVRQALEPGPADPGNPAGLVGPASGDLHWFLDEEAASLLQRVSP